VKRVGFKAAATDALFIILLSSAMLAMAGCAVTEPQVLPISNREVAALSAEDVVQVMLRAGFSDEQILQLGTDLRNELARSGAAQINVEDKVEAIFAVNGDYVYVSSRLRGSFLYDLRKKLATDNQ
jgi:hypothetical protein